MISYEALLQQMSQHVAQAQQAGSEQQMREQLTAIKALCDVVLNTATNSVPMMSKQPSQIQQLSQVTTSSQKLEEADANGDSIFDF